MFADFFSAKHSIEYQGFDFCFTRFAELSFEIANIFGLDADYLIVVIKLSFSLYTLVSFKYIFAEFSNNLN